jgi:hypothetical protein
MVTKVRAAIFGAAVFTAGMVSAIPAASASPVSTESSESAVAESAVPDSGEELQYFWSYGSQAACLHDGWLGVDARLWYADFICWYNGASWELWINPVFLCC